MRRLTSTRLFVLPLCFFCWVLLAVPARALDPAKTFLQYAHRIWGQEEGLFQPTVYSILQSQDGFLWLGTQDSLIRFDGLRFREFPEDHSLHGSFIRALHEDKAGNLWVGSIGSGLTRISKNGQTKHFLPRNGFPSDRVFCLASAAGDALWVCTNNGLVHIATGGTRVYGTSDGLPTAHIRAASEAADGTVWVAGVDFGLYRSIRGARFASYTDSRVGSRDRFATLLSASDAALWAGKSNGLVRIGSTGSKTYTVRDGLPDNEVFTLAEGPDHALWVGTKDGVTRLRGHDLSVYRTRDGLSHSQVLSLYIDREGSLWAGTKDGLNQFTDGKLTSFTSAEGLASNDVGPVLEDSSHRLWIGTLGAGLERFDGQRFRLLSHRDGLLSNTVLSLALDSRGVVWVGSTEGVNRVEDGRVSGAFTTREGLSGPTVRSLFVDAEGTLWAGTNRGLDRFDGHRFIAAPVAPELQGKGVVALGGDRNVRLFAGFEEPVLQVLASDRPLMVPTNNVNPVDSVFVDPASQIAWMSTLGSGLLRWRMGALVHVYLKDGLYDNRIYSILDDNEGHFWLASSKGVFRVNRQELEDLADGKRQSFSSLPFSTGQLRFECRAGVQPAATRTHDGRLWFSTTTGLVMIDPQHLLSNRMPPPVAITSILVNGQRLSSGTVHLRLKPSQTNNLEIRYAGLSFISPEKVTFRYMLAGYDNQWIDSGSRREAFYTNLPPGEFTFRVDARNADGIWSRSAASYAFTVEPKLYQRRWFIPALVLLCALLGLAAFRLRVRRLRIRFELVLAERNRIARELHDTLLQGLAGITMQLQALSNRMSASKEKQILGEIIRDAGRCATEARQSLWNLRQTSTASSDFSTKLTEVVREAVGNKPIALSISASPVSLRHMPDTEFQLLRIAREATANAVKHSSARQLFVQSHLHDGSLMIEIKDDGIGAGSLASSPGHFGIESMRERAAEIGASISIDSSGGGTAVRVTLPLAKSTVESNPNHAGEHPIEVG